VACPGQFAAQGAHCDQSWYGPHSLPVRLTFLMTLGQALTGWSAGASRHWIAVDVVALANALGVSIWRASVSRAEPSPFISALVRAEARRALLRNDPGALPGLPAILSAIAQIPVSEAILDSAAMFPEPLLRSLDAIHLASAQSITAVTAVLAYHKHLIDAARNAGLTAASPA
jgi:hypothetical protein